MRCGGGGAGGSNSSSVVSDSLWPDDYIPPGSSVHGIFQARILEWVAFFFFRGPSQHRDQTWVSCVAGGFFMKPLSIVVVQSLSCVWLFLTPRNAACQAFLSFTISQSLLKLMSTESVMPSNHLILCCLLLLLPSIFPSIRVFSNESSLHIRCLKYWSFSFTISLSSEYLELISFRIDWFDLLGVQETLESLLQCHSSKASVLWCSAFFMVQLSHALKYNGSQMKPGWWLWPPKPRLPQQPHC